MNIEDLIHDEGLMASMYRNLMAFDPITAVQVVAMAKSLSRNVPGDVVPVPKSLLANLYSLSWLGSAILCRSDRYDN